MKTIKRTLINICSDKLDESKHFYTKLFDFDIDYDSDWFIHLISKDKQFELGIIERNNEIEKAIIFEDSIIMVCAKCEHSEYPASAYYNKGFYLYELSKNKEALYNFFEALKFF